MKSRQARLVAALGVVLGSGVLSLSPSEAFAQTGAGTVTGTLRDTTQAPVPGAEVTITNTETNVSTKTQANEVGVYYLGALPRGPYRLAVEKKGFKKWEGTLQLPTGQTVVVDAVLALGDVQTVVEVTGAAPIVSSQSIEVAGVKDFERIRQLPLSARDISLLFQLTPGVEGTGSARVNGLKVGSMEIT
ncbi:MAG: hypothetical protein DMG23_10225, partial [Acidobacteria bacterium]